jgi:hypothetical protein
VGLYCFGLANVVFERTEQVVRHLVAEQVRSDDVGGWAVRTTNGVPIVEATAWVLRALCRPEARSAETRTAVNAGIAWLERNQNTDFGWGSYKDQPSRVFLTALSILALQESGGPSEVTQNALKWLIEAQSPNESAWGPLPAAEPTLLHTSMSLMALTAVQGSLTAAAVRQTEEWILARLAPGEHVERATAVEEYDVPYQHNESWYTFQNALPHFAGPVAMSALLWASMDPLQAKVFQVISQIIDTQETHDPGRAGTWELPRSPTRPSIWAIWPFVAALTAARARVLPVAESTAILMYPGCAIIQSANSKRHLTRSLLIRNAMLDWLRARKVTVGLWVTALAVAVILVVLWRTGQLTLGLFLAGLLLPVLILVFQILWDTFRRAPGGS